MKTSAFIDRVLKATPSATRTGILDTINDAIGFIVDRPLAIMRFKDPLTGLDPVLNTTAGVYQYTLSTGSTGWDFGDMAFIGGASVDSSDYTESLIYSNAFNSNGGAAVITFKEEPGTASYYILAYSKPTVLLSEKNNNGLIPFPDNLTSYLYELVVATLERQFHGQSSRYDEFVNRQLPTLRGQVNETSTFVTYSSFRNY
jgi:hypothetical protein